MKYAREMSQGAHYQVARRRMADANETMMDLMYGPNPITRDELVALIRKRPEVYRKYASHLKNLKRRAPRYTQARRSR